MASALWERIRRRSLPPGCAALWFLGQNTVALKAAGRLIVTDPYLSDSCTRLDPSLRRRRPPLVAPEEAEGIDLVLVSHEHQDHLDPDTLPALLRASPQARLVAPRAAQPLLAQLPIPLERAHLLTGEEGPQEIAGVRVEAIPSAHETLERTELGHRWLGYVLELDGVRVYFAGDGIPYPGLAERLAALDLDVLLLPINGRDYFRQASGIIGNFTYREAVELARSAGSVLLVPLHFDLFAANGERLGAFVDFAQEAYPDLPIAPLAYGQELLLARS
jgi:L-ascorbate 6-phosphate lactonase